jgi:hypothetical protein
MSPEQYITVDLPGAPWVRSVTIARWLRAVHARGAWTQLTRERDIHGPAGQHVRAALWSRVDEIQDVDLVEGASTTVLAAFERAAQRAARTLAALDPESDVELAPPPWRLPEGMRALTTPRQLATEGRDMGHCVAAYGPAVQAGQSVIIALSVAGQRSTAELSRDGRVYQHRGPKDGEPAPEHRQVLQAFVVERRRAS